MPAPRRTKNASSRQQDITRSTKAANAKAKSTPSVVADSIRRTTRQSAGQAKSSSEEEVLGPQSEDGDNPELMMTGALVSVEQPASSLLETAAQSPASPQQNTGIASRRTSVQRPASVLRSFGTPGMDTSIFKFKKRRRQGSIISQVQRTIGMDASNLGDTELDLELDLDDSRFDLDDFNPDDESTPLQGTIMKSAMRTSSSKRRRYDDTPIHGSRAVVLQSSSPPASEMDGHSDNDVPDSEADIVPATTNNTQTEPEAVTIEDQSVSDELSSEINVEAEDVSLPNEAEAVDIQANGAEEEDEPTSTMAPPLSSSMIEPSSPRSPQTGARAKEYQSIHMSTIQLQSLLPRTRFQRNTRLGSRTKSSKLFSDLGDSNTDLTSDNIEVETSDPGTPTVSDDDENDENDEIDNGDDQDDSFGVTTRTRTRASSRAVKPVPKSKLPPKTTRRPLRSTKTAKDGATVKPVTTPKQQKGKRKSYRRPAEEDKENEGEEEEEEVSYAPIADEEADESTLIELDNAMQKMKQKFADVDDWDLAYEIVDHGGESSPWR